MKDVSYENAFGKAPDSFKNRVASALVHMEEEQKMKRFTVRMIVIAAIVLILMAGVVYAASTEWKILNFATGWYHKAPVTNLQKAIIENDVRQTFQAGDYEVTVEEAIADGRFMYISANVRIKSGSGAYFLPMRMTPYKTVGETMGRHFYIMRPSIQYPLEQGFQEPNTMFTEDAPVSEDSRALWKAAEEDGKRLLSATLWVSWEGRNNEITSFTVLPDGSVSFVLGSEIHSDAKVLNATLQFVAEEVSPQNLKKTERVSHTLPLEVPVSSAMETRQADVAGITLEGTDITFERLEFYLTPLTLHYELQFTSAADFKKSKSYLVFLFFNEKDKMIMPGMTIRIYTKKLGENKYVQIGSLSLDRIPETLFLKGHEAAKSTWIDNIPLKIQ